MIRLTIERAHRKGRRVGLCGQAPSDHPEFARFLADAGIDSISVTSDALPKVLQILRAPPVKGSSPERAPEPRIVLGSAGATLARQ
jgi:pyruvate,water dikinase